MLDEGFPQDILVSQDILDCKAAAEMAGLNYASADEPGISRRRSGKGFTYRGPDNQRMARSDVVARIRALAIPPAWTSVWICPDPNGHIQAIGMDGKGRRQYRYHGKFREVRDGVKFVHMMQFAEILPVLRRQVASDMASPGLGRQKILATIVHLLEATMIRVGNRAYAKQNRTFGLTTMQVRHVRIEGSELRFHFKGKSGKVWKLSVRDRRVARIVRGCQELPGQNLFQYLDGQGAGQTVTSADVNAYLKTVTGMDISAKDFRTWTGTVLAASTLAQIGALDGGPGGKKSIVEAIRQVANHLGNTPTICRKCYVHPEILTAYLEGELVAAVGQAVSENTIDDIDRLKPEESAVLDLLRARLARLEPRAKAA